MANDLEVKKNTKKPRKSWRQCVMKDMNLVNISDDKLANKKSGEYSRH